MLTEFSRDVLFTVAWFGLMAMVWFGWAQEDPPRRARAGLVVGSVLGVALSVTFGVFTVLRWDSPTALAGRYVWFGVLVGLEVLVAAAGCLWLARTGRHRWMAWWVGMVVAAHFVPLGWFLADVTIAIVGLVQLAVLLRARMWLRSDTRVTSRLVGPVMGVSMLIYALAAGALAAPSLMAA